MWHICILALTTGVGPTQAPLLPVVFKVDPGSLQINIAGKPFATYVHQDAAILRPFFAHVRAPSGIQVTRSHPPIDRKDATDHATMHPGIWLAFGDLGGADFWRNKGTVKHAGMTKGPTGDKGFGSFTVKNRYEASGKLICTETCGITIQVRPGGYLLLLDSQFTSPADFAFGDQEEMGLGVRVATALTVKNGGQIVNKDAMKNEKQVWGKQADWCSYWGTVDGNRVGVLLMPHPRNFRRSWFHARDYGLLVANPFGQRAFTRGQSSRFVINKDQCLRLRFGVLVYDGPIDLDAAYLDYLKLAGD